MMSPFTIWLTRFFFFLAIGLINKSHMLAVLQSATVCFLKKKKKNATVCIIFVSLGSDVFDNNM